MQLPHQEEPEVVLLSHGGPVRVVEALGAEEGAGLHVLEAEGAAAEALLRLRDEEARDEVAGLLLEVLGEAQVREQDLLEDLYVYIYIYNIYTYIYTYIHTYIYIYIERERDVHICSLFAIATRN